MSSKTASMARSTSAKSSYFVVPWIMPTRCSTSAGVMRPRLTAGIVVPADDGKPAIQGSLFDIEQHHLDIGVGKGHGDTATHGARTDDAHGPDVARRNLGDAWHIGHFTFGLQKMAPGRRIGNFRHRAPPHPAT